MSTGDQFVSALISSLFDVFTAVLLGAFNSIVLPILEAVPGILGIAA